MSECIFCKIVNGDVPCEKIYEDEDIFAFKDINPSAPIHVLFIPKKHFASLNDMNESEVGLLGKLLLSIKNVAKDLGVNDSGYRTIINTNKDSGQMVFHVHAHLLGGKKLGGLG